MQRRSDDATLVYATAGAPARTPTPVAAPVATGVVRIWLEKKGRNGTPVSIVRGLSQDREALAALASRLKRACGTGGSAKDGEIIIQGDHRARIAELLEQEGVRAKLAGG